MPDRLGWICARCRNSLSPDSIDCPACAPEHAVPGFRPGDRVWPKADGPMALQHAPQIVLAAHRSQLLGDWLWLDSGLGRYGSWAAEHWTTEEPSTGEQAELAERKRRRAEENQRMTAGSPRIFRYPVGCEDYDPDRCPECHMPLTMHHEPGCSRPCERCAESNARKAEEARRTLRLPEYMLNPAASQITRITTVWAEVFPGLDASLRSVRTGVAEVDFRITPQEDGQARD